MAKKKKRKGPATPSGKKQSTAASRSAKTRAFTAPAEAAVAQVACPGAAISTLVVDQANWSGPAWRIRYLCAQARLGLHYLHDEPWPQNRRRVYFASF